MPSHDALEEYDEPNGRFLLPPFWSCCLFRTYACTFICVWYLWLTGSLCSNGGNCTWCSLSPVSSFEPWMRFQIMMWICHIIEFSIDRPLFSCRRKREANFFRHVYTTLAIFAINLGIYEIWWNFSNFSEFCLKISQILWQRLRAGRACRWCERENHELFFQEKEDATFL